MQKLPGDILRYVAGFLPIIDIIPFSTTCKSIKSSVYDSEVVWRPHIREHLTENPVRIKSISVQDSRRYLLNIDKLSLSVLYGNGFEKAARTRRFTIIFEDGDMSAMTYAQRGTISMHIHGISKCKVEFLKSYLEAELGRFRNYTDTINVPAVSFRPGYPPSIKSLISHKKPCSYEQRRPLYTRNHGKKGR